MGKSVVIRGAICHSCFKPNNFIRNCGRLSPALFSAERKESGRRVFGKQNWSQGFEHLRFWESDLRKHQVGDGKRGGMKLKLYVFMNWVSPACYYWGAQFIWGLLEILKHTSIKRQETGLYFTRGVIVYHVVVHTRKRKKKKKEDGSDRWFW